MVKCQKLCQFCRHERLAAGRYRWCLHLVLMQSTAELVSTFSRFINKNLYLQGKDKMSALVTTFQHRLLLEFLGFAPTTILSFVFYRLYTSSTDCIHLFTVNLNRPRKLFHISLLSNSRIYWVHLYGNTCTRQRNQSVVFVTTNTCTRQLNQSVVFVTTNTCTRQRNQSVVFVTTNTCTRQLN